jgi:hypothetical protein
LRVGIYAETKATAAALKMMMMKETWIWTTTTTTTCKEDMRAGVVIDPLKAIETRKK